MALIIYLVSVASGIKIATSIMAGSAGLVAIIYTIFANEDYTSEKDKAIYFKYVKRASLITVCLTLLAVLIPSGQTVAAMYVVPKLANNEQLQSITENGLNGLVKMTEQWAKDIGEIPAEETK